MVFAFHICVVAYFAAPTGSVMSAVFGAGETGVSLFFILSGFVLAWSQRPDDTVPRFWFRRWARVWPLHIVAVCLALIVAARWVPVIRSPEPAAVVANILLVNGWTGSWWQAGNPVSWSLACEAFFYLVFPLLWRVLNALPTVALAASTVLALPSTLLASLLPALTGWAMSSYSHPLLRLPEFVAGILVAMIMRRGAWAGPTLGLAIPVALAGCITSSALPTSAWAPAGFTLPGYVLLVAALARTDLDRRPTWMRHPAMVRLGEWSFAFYLVHLLVIGSLGFGFADGHPLLPPGPALLLTLMALAVSTGLAFLLHTFLERPAQRLLLQSLPRPIKVTPTRRL